jgi:methionine biosynthesis protein MetW
VSGRPSISGSGYRASIATSYQSSDAAQLRVNRTGAYESPREDIVAHVPASCRKVLDLGCSSGALGGALKRRAEVTVVGVELDSDYAAEAARHLDRVVQADVESFLAHPECPEAPFDCLVAADVLEHLVDPWGALARATELLRPGAAVVVSLPNVSHWRGVFRLIAGGRWPRDEHGPFDATHLRWFTRADAIELLSGAGVIDVTAEPRYWTTGWRLALHRLAARCGLERFVAMQYIVSGHTRPHVQPAATVG